MQEAAAQVIEVAKRLGVTPAAFYPAYKAFRDAWPRYTDISRDTSAAVAASSAGKFKVPADAPPGTEDAMLKAVNAWAEVVVPGVTVEVIGGPATYPDTWTSGLDPKDRKNIKMLKIWKEHMIKGAKGDKVKADVTAAFERAFESVSEELLLAKLYGKWCKLVEAIQKQKKTEAARASLKAMQ